MYVNDPPVFELRSGRVALDSTVVLKDVDFTLRRGEFLALLGPNGSGKSTLVRALLGLVPLSSGSIRVFDEEHDRFGQWFRVGYVPQRVTAASGTPASVMEVVISGRVGRTRRLRSYRPADRAVARRALAALDLTEYASVPIVRLSGGLQQRALIARALAGEPDVLVLDEPVSGVDLEHQQKLAELLREFNDDGGSVLLVAHTLGPTEELITREVVMEAGEVAYDGPHLPHHIHVEHVHHPERPIERSPLDRAAGAS